MDSLQRKIITTILFLTPLVFFTSLNQIFEIGKLFILSILLFLLSLTFISKKEKINIHPILYIIGTYVFFVFLSTILSNQIPLSFWGSMERHQGFMTLVLSIIFLLFLISQKDFTQNISRHLKYIIISSTAVCILALLQKFNLDSFLWNKQDFLGRVFSTMGHPNFLGQFLVLIIPLILFYLFKSKELIKRILYSSLLILHIYILFLTGSRASFIALYFSIVLFFVLYFLKSNRQKILAIILSVFVPIIFVLSVNIFSNLSVVKNTPLLQRLVVSEDNNRSIFTRLNLWGEGIKAIKEKPIIGYGPESQMIEMGKYMNKYLLKLESINTIPDRLHNEFLDSLFIAGFLGTATYYLFIIFLSYYAFKYLKANGEHKNIIIVSLCSILAYTVSNFFGFPAITHLIYFWFFVAIIISITSIGKEQQVPKVIFVIISILLLGNAIFVSKEVYANYLFKNARNNIENDSFDEAHYDLEKVYNTSNYFEYSLYYINNIINTDNPELFENGLKVLDDLKKKIPHFTDIYLLEGRLYSRFGLFDEANKSFKLASEYSPFNTKVWSDWGTNLYNQEKYRQANQKFEHLLSIVPSYWDENTLNSDYEKNQARIFFKHNNDFRLNFLYLSRSYFQIDNSEQALYYLQFANLKSMDTLTTYGVIFGNMGDYEKALSYYKKALELDRNNSHISGIIDQLNKTISESK